MAPPAAKDEETQVKRKVKLGKHPAVRAYMKKIASETPEEKKKRIKQENIELKKLHDSKVKRSLGSAKRRQQERRSRIVLHKNTLLNVVKRVKGYKKIALKKTRKQLMTTNARPRLVEKIDGKFYLKGPKGRKILVNSKYVKEKGGKYLYKNKKLAKLDKKIVRNPILQSSRRLVNLKFARRLASVKSAPYRTRAEKLVLKNTKLAKFFTELAKKKNTTFRKICGQIYGYKVKIDPSAPDGYTKERKVRTQFPLEAEKKKRIRMAKPKVPKLKKNYKPGTVLIILKGTHRGKHVVFLKQMKHTGKLLCTGPYLYNKVPLRRFDQRYTIATSTRIDVSGLDVIAKINDSLLDVNKDAKFAARSRLYKSSIFTRPKSRKLVKRPEELKKIQLEVDKYIVKKVETMKPTSEARLMKSYLRSFFTIRRTVHPHKLKF